MFYVKKNATPEEQLAAKTRWADYIRMRRKPLKTCGHCMRELPNDGEHFSRGRQGWLTQTCLECIPAVVEKRRPPESHEGKCPICEEREKLVLDKKAGRNLDDPVVVRVCRRCLIWISVAPSQAAYERYDQYMRWRGVWTD
jgi:hypothetical protein